MNDKAKQIRPQQKVVDWAWLSHNPTSCQATVEKRPQEPKQFLEIIETCCV